MGDFGNCGKRALVSGELVFCTQRVTHRENVDAETESARN